MIVLGVAPGLKALAYSVIRNPGKTGKGGQAEPPRPIDHDVLLGGRVKSVTSDLAKKAHVHALVLEVVLERDPPSIIAVGPPCNAKEPPEHVQAAWTMLNQLAQRVGVGVLVINEERLMAALCLPRESLPRAVNRLLGPDAPLDTDDPRLVRAVATALAAPWVPA